MAEYTKEASQVALITGSARRIGAIIAENLHTAGFNVAIHYRHSKTQALALAKKLNAKRAHSAITLQADLSSANASEELIQSCIDQFDRLDCLINNASEYFPTPIGQATEDDWQRLFSSNAFAPFFLAQAAKVFLQKSKGSIINLIDINAHKPLKNYPIYCAAKAALKMLTQSLALELAPTIRVNGIAPGNTIAAEGPNELSPEAQQLLLQENLLQRQVDPNDIAATVLFLHQNKSITGQIVNIDAGRF